MNKELTEKPRKPSRVLQEIANSICCGICPPADPTGDLNRAEGLLKGAPIIPHEETVDMDRILEIARKRAVDFMPGGS